MTIKIKNVIDNQSVRILIVYFIFPFSLIAAEKGEQKIAVEVKSFVARSTISEFHRAVGQFNDYFVALEEYDPVRVLYLAVPETIYNGFFQKNIIRKSLARIGAKIVVYDPVKEKIISWTK